MFGINMEYKLRHYWNKKLEDLNLEELEYFNDNGYLNIREYLRAKVLLIGNLKFNKLQKIYPINDVILEYKSFENYDFKLSDVINFVNNKLVHLNRFVSDNFIEFINDPELALDFVYSYIIFHKMGLYTELLNYDNTSVNNFKQESRLWQNKFIIREPITTNTSISNFMDKKIIPSSNTWYGQNIIKNVIALAENGYYSHSLDYLEKHKNKWNNIYKRDWTEDEDVNETPYRYYFYKTDFSQKLGKGIVDEFYYLEENYLKYNERLYVTRAIPLLKAYQVVFKETGDYNYIEKTAFVIKKYYEQYFERLNGDAFMSNKRISYFEWVWNYPILMAMYLKMLDYI